MIVREHTPSFPTAFTCSLPWTVAPSSKNRAEKPLFNSLDDTPVSFCNSSQASYVIGALGFRLVGKIS